jgi:hypothetical protein
MCSAVLAHVPLTVPQLLFRRDIGLRIVGLYSERMSLDTKWP